MINFEGVPIQCQPRILGLTATLLNANVKPNDVESEIRTLECTFMASIATSVNEEMVAMYSTNPIENTIEYTGNDTTSKMYQIRDRILENCMRFVNSVQVEEPIIIPPGSKPPNSKLIDKKERKTNKRLVSKFEDIKVNMDDLGVYGGDMAVLAHLVQVIQMIPNCQLEAAKQLFLTVITELIYLRHIFQKEMVQSGLTSIEAIKAYSSNKTNRFLALLKGVKPTDSMIVFTKRRFTAKILYYVLKRASAVDPRLKHIKSNFIVGYNVGNPFKDTRENYLQRDHNRKVMNQFNQGELNVLIASNVVEEGVDIQKCNFVVMFDGVSDFRSYIQSKGRARDVNSRYIIMVCVTEIDKFNAKYKAFNETETALKKILYGGKFQRRRAPTEAELNESIFLGMKGLEPYKPHGENGPVVTALSAVPLINRYFASLKTDKFTKIIPWWWLEEQGPRRRCCLQLPMESKVRGLVEGTWQSNQENAKRSAALEACKLLHQEGELDDYNLLPVGINDPAIQNDNFTPCIDNSEVTVEEVGDDKFVKVGTKKYKRSCEKKWADCLCECYPLPDKENFLHVIDVLPVDLPQSDNHRLIVMLNTLNLPHNFAILSSKKLPKLAPFPLYMSTGEMEATVREVLPITLSEANLKRISDFHGIIFDHVLKVSKKFMIRNFKNTQNSYLIAPVIRDSSGRVTIDWNVMEEVKNPFPSTETKPSNSERQNLSITDENYLGKIVSPWYRTVPTQKYLVTKVCYDMSEDTKFPNSSYFTYKNYFKEKYKIETLQAGQPLLEVRALSERLNSIKPRALTKQLKRKNKEENEDFEVWLIPEYCVVYPLSGKYWVKAMMLPSALHRISQLCLTEELRCQLVSETGIGEVHLPSGRNWDKLAQDINCQVEELLPDTQQALTSLNIFSKNSNSLKNEQYKVWGNEEEPMDIERCMDTATLFDVLNYGKFIKKPLLGLATKNVDEAARHKLTSMDKRPVSRFVEPPPLQMLQRNTKGLGPQQVHLLQALTAAVANDIMNCERLETLGDSFLKFAISLTLFENKPDWPEGHLTYVKSKIVGNKNLFYCGTKKRLGSLLEVHRFSPKEDWVPPGFCVEQSVQTVLRTAKLDPNCLYSVQIPEAERAAGKIGESTHTKFTDILLEADDNKLPQNWTFINLQALTDKNVSDAVEAILGTYLMTCGLFGALAVLNWFQVTNPAFSTPKVFTQKTCSPAKGRGNPDHHLIDPSYLENILNYKFNDRCFLLQAVSHPSYTRNNITTCYQRLEFLGDAVIDFLITIHIYEKCETLTPGDLTDLRSALVNNVTLSCISVRNQLHKFLLHNSNVLNDCMMRFVKHQEDRNHIIDNDILFLFEESDVNIAEAVDVPKSLGDIFEALIGAIYLDSGKNLDVTWKVVYNLMKDEIDKFHKDVPKNHVRMLYESECGPNFKSSIQTDSAVMVTVEISHKGVIKTFNGFGDNKRQAKRAAAKHALRAIRTPSN
ncbi:endoribonuclease Dicer-like isoform X1 [Homalodisca vitripennis]|uniref:endoribonuclease Dicer-like isoform X1 n=1 Tax=Homalodisca vitripennis TaxID=197043 RepID=UPI001EEB179D|nr:endoribonuclease Dicer-like isoform X1 [Homalodisca vitripennis]